MSSNGKSYMADFVQSRTTAYPQPWANAKHSASQVNGETQQNAARHRTSEQRP
ncbi:YpzG family protein [Bacillus safensis]|uniref:YpzG family protein n=1 Tax=Bacillus safensis TaxID=561879 RepID=UPI003BF4BFAD